MNTRRDFIKWVLYLGATAALPAISSVADIPHDVLEGMSCIDVRIANLSGHTVSYRAAEDTQFMQVMRDVWRQENGAAKYVQVFQDMGIQIEHEERDPDTGEVRVVPDRYVSFIQYRRV